MNNLYILLYAFLTLQLFSCGPNKESSNEMDGKNLELDLPMEFNAFYDEFHEDTSFQLDHIIFPLKGIVAKLDSTGIKREEKIYSKENWLFHRAFPRDGGYNQSYQFIGDMLIEKISDNLSLLEIERRWAHMDSTWYLIYYSTLEKQW